MLEKVRFFYSYLILIFILIVVVVTWGRAAPYFLLMKCWCAKTHGITGAKHLPRSVAGSELIALFAGVLLNSAVIARYCVVSVKAWSPGPM